MSISSHDRRSGSVLATHPDSTVEEVTQAVAATAPHRSTRGSPRLSTRSRLTEPPWSSSPTARPPWAPTASMTSCPEPRPRRLLNPARELAVRPVDLAPLVEQGQDLGRLLGQDAVHRGPARRAVAEAAAGSTGVPPVGTDLAQIEHCAGAPSCPTGIDGFVYEVQQFGLGGRVDPAWDSATQPQPPFPSTNVSLTASSLQASESRATSALAASSS